MLTFPEKVREGKHSEKTNIDKVIIKLTIMIFYCTVYNIISCAVQIEPSRLYFCVCQIVVVKLIPLTVTLLEQLKLWGKQTPNPEASKQTRTLKTIHA